jgi:hypothetical protein
MLGAKSPSEREEAPGPLVPRVIQPAFSLTCSAAPSRPGCGPLSARQFMEGSIGKQRQVAFALIDKAENCRRNVRFMSSLSFIRAERQRQTWSKVVVITAMVSGS